MSLITVSCPGSSNATISRTRLKSGYGDFGGSPGKHSEERVLGMVRLLRSLMVLATAIWKLSPNIYNGDVLELEPD